MSHIVLTSEVEIRVSTVGKPRRTSTGSPLKSILSRKLETFEYKIRKRVWNFNFYLLVTVSSLWLMAFVAWLYFAYKLEFAGENCFVKVWVCSIVFHLLNVGLIVAVIYCLSVAD